MGLRDTALSAHKERQEADALALKVAVEKFNREQSRRATSALRAVLGYTDEGVKKLSVKPFYQFALKGQPAKIKALQFEIDGLKIMTSESTQNDESVVSEAVLEVEVFVIDDDSHGETWLSFGNLAELGRLLEEDGDNRRAVSGGEEA